MEVNKQQKHFVLVHGACHGAWCWYKLKPRIESAGHRVTTLDLAASGINTKKLDEVHTFYDYTVPLLDFMASIPPNEKVILVGHSLGGMSIALAMDNFPEKISVAVFVCAFMPDTLHQPSYVLDQLAGKTQTPVEAWMDTQFSPHGKHKESSSILFGPKFLSTNLYQLCSVEDLTLGKMLMRPGSLFLEDLSEASKLSNEGYGSVTRIYIVCDEDKAIPEEHQRWMIEISGLKEVKEIKGSDHMPMFMKPDELSQCLAEIANKYA